MDSHSRSSAAGIQSGEETARRGLAADRPAQWNGAATGVSGVAYDPGSDLVYLRVAPGNQVRVVRRTTAQMVREFTANEVPATGGGGLALRRRDQHLFFALAERPVVIETTAAGDFVRRLTLTGTNAAPAGLAWDQQRDLLLILQGGDLSYVSFFDAEGHRLRGVSLDRNVRLGAFAYDSEAQQFYVPMADDDAIGVFGPTGELVREISWRGTKP